ncbi:MAG: N-acetylneuraminate synthase family protein [Verrucomicrobiae bacterium]|nr:N-acetylneuraminate synthase family protein [Verrucomicrobiae bacterium]
MKPKQMIIAEIGSVHDGSFGNACKLIEAAAQCGADAVKFQTHIAEAETLPQAPAPAYFQGEPRFSYFQRTAFSETQYRALMTVARENKVLFLSSPFSLEAVDFLENIGMAAYKIPSGEVTNLPLLEKIASTGKPVLLSSGMADWDEMDRAVNALQNGGPLTVMQCSSRYPCPPEKVGLNVMLEMGRRYPEAVMGYSDHTLGLAAPVAAAALGARVIEKHFTFSRLMYGSDARHSMEPAEFSQLTAALREVWSILDHPVDKSRSDEYAEMKRIFEKSIVLAAAIPAGTILTRAHLQFKKPGDGIRADRVASVLGKKTTKPLPAQHTLTYEDLE